MKKMKNKMAKASKTKAKLGVANWLTILRMLLMIPFLAMMSAGAALILAKTGGGGFRYDGIKLIGSNSHKLALSIIYWTCVSLFIVAMITDFVDGFYARKTKTVSNFGKVFDPIADKVATTMMMIFLAIFNFTYLPIVILFIVRDIMVDGSRMYAAKKDVKVNANWWGKIKTIIVSLSLLVIAFSVPWLKENEDSLKQFYVNIPLLAGLILAWVSGIIYICKYLKGITKDNNLDSKKEPIIEMSTNENNQAIEKSDMESMEITSSEEYKNQLTQEIEQAKNNSNSTNNSSDSFF
ncbi:CDP-diacylglycerol--glycerol-3-phosphate 3-phosphatidyltransferase [Metamycoplasma equirhinis]|uniref:CDP-diacylglycerol--glycerol-3-phosphate 3-phosphatidyltransferase n=1 Tax=Metamycoplasma equirhinis TaxID=92402 RepID=UPI00359C6274